MTHNDRPPGSSAIDATAIVNSLGEVFYRWSLADDALHWSDNVGAVLKVASPVLTGKQFAHLVDPTSGPTRHDTISQSERKDSGQGVPYRIEYCFRPAADSDLRFWLEDSGRWFAGPDGKPAYAHGILRVINERHAHEQQLTFLAQCDALTGEFNRWHLNEILLRAIDDATRMRASCGFLLIAIDNLARLNESYGFAIGDEVISAVARRLRSMTRGKDALGRISGNKFGVVLKQCTPEEIAVAAERLLAGVRADMVQTALGPVAATITIGGVNAPRHARTVEEVLACAHDALAGAKAKRQGSFLAYRPSPDRDAMRRDSFRSTDEIVAALNDRRISLAFEPIAKVHTREPDFYECLMRVHAADGSLLPTQQVVPVAERLGLIRLLDHRVFELAVAELVRAPMLKASVNVSPASTTDPDWWAGLGALLRANPGVGERLTVEITETAAIHNIDDTRGFVARVKDLGCRIAIDDFGAGYTSFRNLRKLGVDVVKIDGAFVVNMLNSADDCAFVQTLIDLARRLGLKTVAEWVQDAPTAETLAALGCDYLQGQFVGLASPERPWLAEQPAAASA